MDTCQKNDYYSNIYNFEMEDVLLNKHPKLKNERASSNESSEKNVKTFETVNDYQTYRPVQNLISSKKECNALLSNHSLVETIDMIYERNSQRIQNFMEFLLNLVKSIVIKTEWPDLKKDSQV